MNDATVDATGKNQLRDQCRAAAKDHWNAPITEYGEAYYAVLVAEYRTLAFVSEPAAPVPTDAAACCQPSPCERRRAAARVIEELIARPLEHVLWRDLLVMEAMLAKMQTKEAIGYELTLLRAEFKEMTGLEAYEALKLPMVPLPPTDADYPKALAEYETLLQELHWNLLSAPAREGERTNLLVAVTQSLGLLVVAAALVWWLAQSRVLAFLIVCGGLGAWVSAFRRAQSPALHSTVLLNLRRSRWSRLSFSLAPWLGGISAVALAFIFAGGIVNGRFFPTVRWTDHLDAVSTNMLRGATNVVVTPSTNAVVTLPTNVAVTGGAAPVSEPPKPPAPAPASPAPLQWHANNGQERWWFGADTEHALLLLWAFLAGFSERLVPDLLNRIAKKTEGAG